MSNISSTPTYPGLPLPAPGTPPRKKRVCIASFDFVGPVRNGGVGTAFTSLGEALAAAGHEVTLLFVSGRFCENGSLDQWVAYYKQKNITFIPMPVTCKIPIAAPLGVFQSYQAYLWLLEREFDVIHFSEWKGPGYFALLAKQQGTAFQRTLLCVHTHGPTLWHKLSNSEFVTELPDVENDFVECASVKMADVIASPSYYLLDWMKEQGWDLPSECYVQQYVRPATARKHLPGSDAVQRINELVFFGRLEHRKGLVLFCDALDRLQGESEFARLTVTFLGKPAEINRDSAADYIGKRARNWPWKCQIIGDRDQAGAMDYLQGGPRLAVMPSLVDNLPNTVLECLGARIPFIASNAGGIPEMILPEDIDATLFSLRPAALAEKLRAVARDGIRPARTKVEPIANERAWVAWHESLKLPEPSPSPVFSLKEERPLVSVCIAHWNRPEYLSQALASIEAQDYPNLEVVVVDDCSTQPEAIAYLDSLEPKFRKRGWQILRQTENRYPGAARNRGVKAAHGEYILFMDDDNVAKPHEISTFVRVAKKTGADILTCFLDEFEGRTAPAKDAKINFRVIFLGACVAAGVVRNWFGDTNSLVRREAFLALGGFHEQWGVNHEDYEFMAKAVLKGYRLEVVPEALVWFRVNPGENSVIRSTPFHGNVMCSIRPYLESVPPALRTMVLLAQGMGLCAPEPGMAGAQSVSQYTELTILWRSKLEAGVALGRLNHKEAAIKAMIEAVKSVENSRNPKLIFEVLVAVGSELNSLDPKRSRLLLELALKLAQERNDSAGQAHAESLLNDSTQKTLPVGNHITPTNPRVANTTIPANPPAANAAILTNPPIGNAPIPGSLPAGAATIPKGLNHSAQGCAPGATLGTATPDLINSEWVESTAPNVTNHTPTPRVSIVIPTFNNLDLTRQCIAALKQNTPANSHDIVVVDNASNDATVEFLRQREAEGELRLIPNSKNLGFARACNQGAAASKSDYVLFLNNDTEVQPGWLEPLVKILDADEKVAAVGGKLLYPDGTIQHAGVAMADVKGRDALLGFHLFAKEKSDFAMANECRVYPAVTAACVLVRKSLFAQAGGFDEGYWNGYEDVDLCLRFQQNGYLTVYEPACVVIHHESKSGPERFAKAGENIKRLHNKWLGKVAPDFVVETDGKVNLSPNSKVRPYTSPPGRAVPLLSVPIPRRQQIERSDSSAVANSAVKVGLDMPESNAHTGVPKGRNDNSPAIHCRVQGETALSPEGTADQADNHRLLPLGTNQSSFSPSLPRSGGEGRGEEAPKSHHPFKVSIIILAHNQLGDTRQCLASIEQHTPASHELILVDNASRDGTADFFRKYASNRKNVGIIVNQKDLGFAGGNNQGLALARGANVLLLNNDTVVTKGWLERMLNVFDRFPEVGLVGPVSNCVSGPQLISPVKYKRLADLPSFAAEVATANAGQSVEARRLVGFCLLMRRAVVEKLGGLDERFGSGNFEDDDLCLRAGFAGFKLRIAADSFVHHTGSQTFKGAKIDFGASMLRNWTLFKAKWGLPAEQPIENGYRVPQNPPVDALAYISLPGVNSSRQYSPEGNVWTDTAQKSHASQHIGTVLPAKQTSRSEPPNHLAPQLPLLQKFGGEGRGEEVLSPKTVHGERIPSSLKNSTPHSGPTAQKSTQPIKLPECALVGHLADARQSLKKKNLHAAWESTISAIHSRPFHPEAHLLLAEIALAAADSVTARRCAKYTSDIAPDFKPAKKFLKGHLRGNSRHEWLQLPPTISHRESKVAPRLTVCLIAKNEEKFLGQCLASVRGLASQIIVVDTGSTDRTVEIAREHGAEIHSFAWCDDFSAARNEALKHATGDWILNLDADEELLPEHRETILREIQAASVMAYRLPIIDKGREHEGCSYVPRLFRNAPGLFFVGRVHEQIFSSIEVRRGQWGLENRLGTATLLHHGYTSEIVVSREKTARNLRLLEIAIQELPGEPNLLMNLGLELVRSGKLEDGLQRYREALKHIAALPAAQVVPELREALLTQFTTHMIKAGRFAEVLEVWQTPFAKSFDMTASQHFLLGLAFMELKQPADAVTQMRNCLEKRGRHSLTPVHGEIRKAAPNHCLALALAALKDTAASEKTFRAALTVEPESRPLRFDFARFQAEANQPVEALKILNQLIAEQPAEARVWQLGGQIALSRPEFAEFARDWTGEAIKHCPQDTAIILQRAESLLLNQEVEQALPLWLKAHSPKSARHLAALVLCECATGSCNRTFSPSDEPLVSREFQKWYQQLIKASANSLVYQLNESMETLARVLPTFATAWQRAMGSIQKPQPELTASL